METRQEVKRRLRRVLDPNQWPAFLDELEKEIEKIADAAARAAAYRELGASCEEVLLRGDRAVAAYQAAFRLDRDLRALEAARRVYRELGNLATVAKLC